MQKIFVTDISAEDEQLLNRYIEKYIPDAKIETLQSAGIKGRMKNHAKKADVLLVIIDAVLYNKCAEANIDTLKLPKVHRYVDHEGFKKFLEGRFGKLDDDGSDIGKVGGGASSSSFRDDEIYTPESEPVPVSVQNDGGLVESSGGTLAGSGFGIQHQKPIIHEEPAPLLGGGISSVADQNDLDFSDMPSTETFSEDSEEVRLLKEKLQRSEDTIASLEARLREDSSISEDFTALTARIRELKEEVAERDAKIKVMEEESYSSIGKLAKADKTIEENHSLVTDNRKLKEDLAVAKADSDGYKQRLAELGAVSDELILCREEIKALQHELNVTSARYKSKCDELDSIKSEADGYSSKVNELNEYKISVRDELAEKDMSIQDLTNQLEELNATISSLNERITELEGGIESKNLEIANRDRQIDDLKTEIKADERQEIQANTFKERLNDEVKHSRELQTTLNQCNDELDEAKRTIEELRTSLESSKKDNEALSQDSVSLIEVRAELDSKNAKLASLETKVNELKSELETVRSELQDKDSSLESSSGRTNALTEELASVKEELTSVRSELSGAESTINSQSAKIETLNKSLEEEKRRREDSEKQLDEATEKLMETSQKLTDVSEQASSSSKEALNAVTAAKKKYIAYEEQIDGLQSDLASAKEESLKYKVDNDKLKREVGTMKERINVLEENEGVLRKQAEDNTKTGPLRLKIVELEEEIRKLNEAGVANEDADSLVSNLRSENAELQLELNDLQEELDDYKEGIFAEIQNSALPKNRLNALLPIKQNENLKGFNVVASASTSSNLSAYQEIKRVMESKNKNALVIDLSMDSYIDSEFKAKGIQSPYEWLIGDKPFKDYLAKTSLGNVRVISNGLAYLNPLYLLTVDWNTRFEELNKKADYVIFYVGCLNDMVSRLLYQSFLTVMHGHVVVNATPINIRTTMLVLAGLNTDPTYNVYCTGFENTSKNMFERLAKKYNATILNDRAFLDFR